MELLADKFDQVIFVRSFQARSLPYQQLHLGACLAQASFLVVELPISFTDLQARRTESVHAEPPHCREAAQQASETSFALLEGTQEIILITPHSDLQGEKALTSALIPRLHDSLSSPAEREAPRTYTKPDLQACLKLQLA